MEAPATEIVEFDAAIFENLLTQNVVLLEQTLSAILFVIGVGGALLVLYLLYKFLREFY